MMKFDVKSLVKKASSAEIKVVYLALQQSEAVFHIQTFFYALKKIVGHIGPQIVPVKYKACLQCPLQ